MTIENRVSWLGLGVIAFGLFLLAYAIPNWVNSPSNVAKAVLAPTFWPEIIGYILLLLGGILVVQRSATGVSDVVEDLPVSTAEDEDGAPPALPPPAPGPALARLAAIALMMFAYVWLIPLVGMVWTSMVVFILVLLLTRSPGLMVSLLVAIILPLVLYAFFAHVAGVAVPQGDYVSLP